MSEWDVWNDVFVGVDPAYGEDHTGLALRRDGMTYVCTIPPELGRITGLRERHGRVVAETESGIEFIAPVSSLAP